MAPRTFNQRLKDAIDSLKDQLVLERRSHDAEIRRIGAELGESWPLNVEDIIKAIKAIRGSDGGAGTVRPDCGDPP